MLCEAALKERIINYNENIGVDEGWGHTNKSVFINGIGTLYRTTHRLVFICDPPSTLDIINQSPLYKIAGEMYKGRDIRKHSYKRYFEIYFNNFLKEDLCSISKSVLSCSGS